ncbi:MAG: hypothetical protein KA314_03350 [Chloroflexi bacterium]|nr:hypothetical protein [Chloroflexota bacterium]MBP8054848.1 hypothetical protein [Chloroflexota bacterium]
MTTIPTKSSTSQKLYTPPTIIYEGQISTRAGSPAGPIAPTERQEVDPIDLFDNEDRS